MEISRKGLLLILSGPAGSGKGCIVKNILEKDNNIRLSVSATTREPRPGEIDGFHYYFVTHEKFTEMINSDEMLEYTIYCGNYYGTPKEKVRRMIDSGISVILEIELEGAKNVKRLCPDAVSVLILPPDYGILEQRLRGRHTNTEEDIKNRLNRAKSEVASYNLYDYIVINEDDKIDEAAENILQILNAERHKTSRNPNIPTDFFN